MERRTALRILGYAAGVVVVETCAGVRKLLSAPILASDEELRGPAGAGPLRTNLLANPGFEQLTSNPGTPIAWSLQGGRPDASWSTLTDADRGGWVIQLLQPDWTRDQPLRAVSRPLGIPPGVLARARVWARATSGRPGCALEPTMMGHDGLKAWSHGAFRPTPEWRRFATFARISPWADTLEVPILNSGPGAVLADDASLEIIEPHDIWDDVVLPVPCSIDGPDFIWITDLHAHHGFKDDADTGHQPKRSDCWQRIADTREVVNALDPPPAFVIVTGDMMEVFAEDDLVRLAEEFSAFHVPVHFAIGNHDLRPPRVELRSDPKYAPDRLRSRIVEAFGMPGSYYSFDAGGCHFVVLDAHRTKGEYGIDDEQLAWLADDMEKHRRRDTYLFYHAALPLPEVNQRIHYWPHWTRRWLTTNHNRRRVYELLDRHPNVRAGFCGHLHLEYLQSRRGSFVQHVGAAHIGGYYHLRRVLPGADSGRANGTTSSGLSTP